jgi:predicted nuclease of predicted toxin-antitoxin system
VKFLIDNQLPLALCRFLQSRGHEAIHVTDAGLDESSDNVIWQYAVDRALVLISKDEDFLHAASNVNAGTAFVWVRLPNCRKAALLAAFESALPQILEAVTSGQHVVELR